MNNSIFNNYSNFDYLLKKRHRLNSFEEFVIYPEKDVENKLCALSDEDFKIIFEDCTNAAIGVIIINLEL
jgi:hypothetical protein